MKDRDTSMPSKKTKKMAGAAPPSPKRKRVRVKTGQLAAVPLLDGTYALLHVALYDGWVIGAHYAHRRDTPERLLDGIEEAMKSHLVTILAVSSDEIYDGLWPVIGQRKYDYPEEMLDMKGSSYTANMSRYVFNAYYGLLPWDGMADPRCYEKLLLPGVPVPPTVRYKRDFEKDVAAAATAPAVSTAPSLPAEPPITDGPAEIHIEIKYPGDALPSIELLHRRQALEEALEKAGAGEVTDAGGGGGVMDVYLSTEDVRRAMPLVQAAVKASGFEEDARIETTAVDDSGEEGD